MTKNVLTDRGGEGEGVDDDEESNENKSFCVF